MFTDVSDVCYIFFDHISINLALDFKKYTYRVHRLEELFGGKQTPKDF